MVQWTTPSHRLESKLYSVLAEDTRLEGGDAYYAMHSVWMDEV